eukprot:6206266-Pleurochrysis_carterae.AAC.2
MLRHFSQPWLSARTCTASRNRSQRWPIRSKRTGMGASSEQHGATGTTAGHTAQARHWLQGIRHRALMKTEPRPGKFAVHACTGARH